MCKLAKIIMQLSYRSSSVCPMSEVSEGDKCIMILFLQK